MTPKEELLVFVQRMDDNVTIEDVLYKLNLFIGVQEGLAQADQGEGMDDDAFMKELEEEYENEQACLDATSPKGSPGDQKAHRRRRASAGGRVRPKA